MYITRLCAVMALGLMAGMPLTTAPVQADTVRVIKGAPARALQVPMNRAIVVESDTPFAELSVANAGIADISTLSTKTIYVLGKSPGRTSLTLLDAEGRLISNIEVQVAADIAEFKERLRQILPGEKIEVRTANDGVVLSGTVSSAGKLDRALDLAERYAPEKVSNLMTVGGTQQVMLKVRFAEMERAVSKSLSASVGIGIGNSTKTRAIAGSGPIADIGTYGNAISGSARIPVSSGAQQGRMGLSWRSGGLALDLLLEALETKGAVRTLAEPNLTALSGQPAEFLAGGEYPIPVVDDDGVGIEYKKFGILLKFTPRVVGDGVINLALGATVSSLDATNGITQNGFNVSAFKTRATTTTVEMRDGESFAIAGLLQDDFQDLSSQVPWLGDIPILGTLFRSANYKRKQSELVIIVTPHLVTPTRGEAIALPTDRIRPPTESDLFLFGRTVRKGRSGPAGEVAKQDFSGSYGYVME
ncbi:MAG: type II and III secretion system protein family protein [Halocynthiibacter sp.]